MSVIFEKVTFNKKATGGGGEVKKKQKSQYSSGPHALYPQLRVERD